MRFALSFALLAVLGLVGCDTAGVNPLAARRDTLVPCTGNTTTWLRSTETATEILLIGNEDPTTVVLPSAPSCFAYGFVAHDSTTHLEAGSYTLDARGQGEFAHADEYDFLYQPQVAIIRREGAKRTSISPPIAEEIAIRREGERLVLELEGETLRFDAIGAVVDRIDPKTMEGAEDLFRLFNLPLFTSQARLLGFGSGRMTQYIGTTATFTGLIRNHFTVNVESTIKPNTDIEYFQFQDLTGITISGLQETNVNTAGAGTMRGALAFVIRGSGLSSNSLRGTLAYDDLTIGNGVAAGGTYELRIDGVATPYTLSYELATDVDLRRILPVGNP